MRKSFDQILRELKLKLPYLQLNYNVEKLEVFGSYARFDNDSSSDLDLLVSFIKPPSLLKFIQLENYLTEYLEIKVDLVMKKALKKNMSKRILREAKMV
ncbi:MAG: nucleotidyltransferase [Melioribacteraceae bacterium]|nr:MAG: nucleotidyltransferase [Melioribacteraceae bacterium]